MNVEEQEWVQQTLLNYERDRCISKVCSIEDGEAIQKGCNYSSDIKRLKIKVVLNSGEMEDKSVILKMTPRSEHRGKAVRDGTGFTIEARMFNEVLPKMEKIRQSKEKCGEQFFPVCYNIKNGNEDFLFEDLKDAGFELADRHVGLDRHHLEMALKTLAKYHALGAVLIERGEIFLRDFDTNTLKKERKRVETMFSTNFEEFAEHIEESWDAEWQPYAEKLRRFSKTLMDMMLDNLDKTSTQFRTISHGDYHVTNMMFRNNTDGKPDGIRVIDFQGCSYLTPAMDLQYLLNTSPQLDLLDRKRELFLFYCHNLLKYLELYEFAGKKPTQDELDEAFDLLKPYGLTVGLIFRPFMMVLTEQVTDLEECSKNWTENKAAKFSSYKKIGEPCVKILKRNLKEGVDLGLL